LYLFMSNNTRMRIGVVACNGCFGGLGLRMANGGGEGGKKGAKGEMDFVMGTESNDYCDNVEYKNRLFVAAICTSASGPA
jgi:hypothetical protein